MAGSIPSRHLRSSGRFRLLTRRGRSPGRSSPGSPSPMAMSGVGVDYRGGLAGRGRIAERLGDLTTARRAYQDVADDWRHADPELAGYVAEANAGLARVSRKTR